MEIDELAKRRAAKDKQTVGIEDAYKQFFRDGNLQLLIQAFSNSSGCRPAPSFEPGAKTFDILNPTLQHQVREMSLRLISDVLSTPAGQMHLRSDKDGLSDGSSFTFEIAQDLRKLPSPKNEIRCAQFTNNKPQDGNAHITRVAFSIRSANHHDYLRRSGIFDAPASY